MTSNNPTNSPSGAPREHSKAQRLLAMLQTGTGAGLEEMIEATGWQAHTVRAAMTDLRNAALRLPATSGAIRRCGRWFLPMRKPGPRCETRAGKGLARR